MVGLVRCLPVLPIERADLEGGQVDAFDAANIEGPAAGVEAGAYERVDSTVLAEIVLGRLGIELIKGEIRVAGEDTKVRFCRRVPERSFSTTHGAVAINNVVELRPNLEGHPTAMARALIALRHLNSLGPSVAHRGRMFWL